MLISSAIPNTAFRHAKTTSPLPPFSYKQENTKRGCRFFPTSLHMRMEDLFLLSFIYQELLHVQLFFKKYPEIMPKKQDVIIFDVLLK